MSSTKKSESKIERKPKVVEGVHFLWVPKYSRSKFSAHWLSINGTIQVRVSKFRTGEYWAISSYEFGINPGIDEIVNPIDRSNGYGSEKEALRQAASWVNTKMSTADLSG